VLHNPFGYKGCIGRVCAVYAIAMVVMPVGFAREPASKPVMIEVWRGSDDGLTVRLAEAVERSLKASGKFVLSRGKKPGTLLLTIPQHVDWKKTGDRMQVSYTVAFSTADNRELGSGTGTCWEDKLPDCTTYIVRAAAAAAELLRSHSSVLPRDGDYLSTAYLAALEKKKSHEKAWMTGAPQSIAVSRENKQIVLGLNINWHEGDGTKFDQERLGIQFDDVRLTALVPIDATHFRFTDDDTTLTYRYVGNAETYITEKLLVGVYTDAQGHRYAFGADGKAHFPGRTFRYEIYTDMVFEDCDEIEDVDATKPNDLKLFGFAWHGDALYLYNADCSNQQSPSCIIDRKHPIAVLHRLG
jgi:hypothetical protein